jgi:hypothetical protein
MQSREWTMKGSLKRIRALFYARTLEFVRDRAALVWNLLFRSCWSSASPHLLRPAQAAGADRGGGGTARNLCPLRAVPLLKIIPYDEASRGQLKVRHHQLDLLLSPAGGVTG